MSSCGLFLSCRLLFPVVASFFVLFFSFYHCLNLILCNFFLCFHSIRNLTCMQHYSFIRQMTVDGFGIWVVGVFLFVLFFTPIFANADAHVWMAVAQCVVCVHVCVC